MTQDTSRRGFLGWIAGALGGAVAVATLPASPALESPPTAPAEPSRVRPDLSHLPEAVLLRDYLHIWFFHPDRYDDRYGKPINEVWGIMIRNGAGDGGSFWEHCCDDWSLEIGARIDPKRFEDFYYSHQRVCYGSKGNQS